MTDASQFYRQLATALAQGPAVVATVIRTSGSVPREVGAQLLVPAGGTPWGTIGGGAGEAKVLAAVPTVLATGMAQTVTIDLTGRTAAGEGICGGQMAVGLARWQGDAARTLAHTVAQRLAQGQGVTLTIPVAGDGVPMLREQMPGNRENLPSAGQTVTLTLQPAPTLLVVGAGHCGLDLARVAELSGFRVVVQDERPEWASCDRFAPTIQVSTQPVAKLVAQFPTGSQLYAALVTRGLPNDLAALPPLLNRQPACTYIGLMGSKRRVQQVKHTLAAQGWGPDQLADIHAPIGLNIGALTPAEIAVSIVAELIAVRRGGKGQLRSAGKSGDSGDSGDASEGSSAGPSAAEAAS